MATKSIRNKSRRKRCVQVRLSLEVIQALKAMGAEKLHSDIDLSRSLPNMIELALDYAAFGRFEQEVLQRREAREKELERMKHSGEQSAKVIYIYEHETSRSPL